MSVQHQRVAGLKRDIELAKSDGMPTAFISRLQAILEQEESILLRSRLPGNSVTVAELNDLPDANREPGDF